MKRSVLVLGSLFAVAGFLFSQERITLYGIKGPSGIGMIRLFESPPQVAGWQISLEALAQADLMAAKFASGEAKLGILPPNVAAKLYAAGRPIQVLAVVGEGMLSLITADPAIRGIGDLRGKTVEVAGQGATPDFVFRRILSYYGLTPGKDVQLGYALAYPEIAQSLKAGKIQTALLPEPFATMALSGSPHLRVVGNIQDEWNRATLAPDATTGASEEGGAQKAPATGGSQSGGASAGTPSYPMTVFVVDRTFAAANPTVVKAIAEAYRASIQWVVQNPLEAGRLVQKHELGLTAAVATAAIPRSAYVFIPAREARPALERLFAAFLEYAPQSIGGKLPGDDFYGTF
ncbi:MAG TPA: ABC transporter substrate-binding protein [Termitinemataceae bacterium]|nr:ABC transporter substrate-binding protein [Termitinemataceae bacterium]HOM23892.1 ABC transporter substrate-binding protein [Termitinemataceae bacterium]HPQ00913.1 ABC transporter substrate-binding protein [Termitinemataceae bacterium]